MDPNKLVFDVGAILFGTPLADPLPTGEAGFVTLLVPEGVSLEALGTSAIGKQLMHPFVSYSRSDWKSSAPPAGTYMLRVPTPDSGGMTANDQKETLARGWVFAPVVLVAEVLLCIRQRGGADPLGGGWTRCAEGKWTIFDDHIGGDHIGIKWHNGFLHLSDGADNIRSSKISASSVRDFPT